MNWKLSSSDPLMILFYFVKLMGLAPFRMKNNRLYPPKFLDVLYPIFISGSVLLFTLMTLNSKLLHIAQEINIGMVNLMAFVRHLQSFSSTLFTPIIFLVMHKEVLGIFNGLCVVSDNFKKLGIEEDAKKFSENLLVTTVVSNIVMITICFILCYAEYYWHVYISIKISLENWFTLNTVLIFVQLLLYIRNRFTLLSQKLGKVFTPTPYVGSPCDLQMHFGGPRQNPRNKVLMDIQRVQKFEGLHMQLCGLVDQATRLFAISIIFISLEFLVQLSMGCFWMYSAIRIFSMPSNIGEIISIFYDNFLTTLLRTTIVIVQLFTIAHVSTTTRDAKNGMRTILFDVWDETTPQDLQDEFFTFSLQLMHKSGEVSILGFFDLYYSYVCTILGAVAAYGIVLIQVDNLG